jgi:small subunit ribosomal protein S14
MSTLAKKVEHEINLKRIELHKTGKKKLLPRERIRIRMRCRLCGRPRAVYRKFGICRICFRDMANKGLIPGVQKASW